MDVINRIFMKAVAYDAGDPKRIQHFTKVHDYARMIGTGEHLPEKEQRVLEAAAILHDIGIHACEEKYGECGGKLQEKMGPPIAEGLLADSGLAKEEIERICYLIGHHHTYSDIDNLDYQILVEADFLVNLYEDGADEKAVRTVYERIFETNTGKILIRKMFGISG